MTSYEVYVKGNLEWSDPVPVRIISRAPLSEATLDTIEKMRLVDAQAYCQTILKVTITVGHLK